MPEAFIVDAVRTPVARRGGGLAHVHPGDLAAHVIRALTGCVDVDPAAIDDVILGCLDPLGPQAGDIARLAALAAGLPETVPGVTLDRQCGSGQQAVHFAAQAVMSGTADLVIAGGVQSMSQIPLMKGYDVPDLPGPWESAGLVARYGTPEISQFWSADAIAERWDIGREELEKFALESHSYALEAIDGGWFEAEIEPYGGVSVDEGPRRDTASDKLAALAPLREGGRNTAGTSSQISDGSAVLLIASERAVREHGLRPRARIHHLSVLGEDPVLMLTAPIPATRRALARCGLSMDDIDLVEINEAFASVVLAWMKELDVPRHKVNVQGGAIALGHPIGATGARLMTTLLGALERTGGRYGLQTMCEGGGQANVTIIERI
ncbi:acetyl-CoA C-acetyltransferase [Nocardioides humilatus]|uniref:Acetyl-CoA C-acetyltransferase n=1 Tax=Nocardioides humilatus TaxID=2607660 RepID=A0A5B1L8A9_9ACTN|nr:acetyl-CoA C-acetyltransferase [Nocardioides humilatus]KAA1416961.1 acetyl-CoA C-acetyltransferase [Nocardioides humilatus]